jgi:hypothetical protein
VAGTVWFYVALDTGTGILIASGLFKQRDTMDARLIFRSSRILGANITCRTVCDVAQCGVAVIVMPTVSLTGGGVGCC